MQSVRLSRAGDLIETESGPQVVREVLVVLRLANGESLSVPASEQVEVLPPEDLSDLVDEIESAEDHSP